MAEMSRLHDALGHREVPQPPPTGGPRLGQLGWAPESRTTRRRESPGLGKYLIRGILIGGLVWVAWWVGTSRDPSADTEPAAATARVRAAPTEAPLEPIVPAVETPDASDLSADAPSVPGGELSPDATSASTGPDDSVGAQLGDGPLGPAPSLPVISAILLSEGRRLAVVDGRVLGAGQRIGPWELVSVDRDAVVLRDLSGAEQVVTLARD